MMKTFHFVSHNAPVLFLFMLLLVVWGTRNSVQVVDAFAFGLFVSPCYSWSCRCRHDLLLQKQQPQQHATVRQRRSIQVWATSSGQRGSSRVKTTTSKKSTSSSSSTQPKKTKGGVPVKSDKRSSSSASKTRTTAKQKAFSSSSNHKKSSSPPSSQQRSRRTTTTTTTSSNEPVVTAKKTGNNNNIVVDVSPESSLSSSASSSPKKSTDSFSSSSPSSFSSLPPWQVMSDKDAKKNLEKEIERRQLIRQGLMATHQTANDSDDDDVLLLSTNFLDVMDQRFLRWKPFPASAIHGMRFVGSYLGSKPQQQLQQEGRQQLPSSSSSSSSNLPVLGIPEVAFMGRSNVGKSSLLNRLSRLSSSSLSSSSSSSSSLLEQARVSKTPGATAAVNLYALYGSSKKKKNTKNNQQQQQQQQQQNPPRDLLALVDLPGYGYAQLDKTTKSLVQTTAEHYLNTRKQLVLGILLVDIRQGQRQRTKNDSKNDNNHDNNDDRAVLQALYDQGRAILVVATKVDKLKNNNRPDEQEKCLQEIRIRLGLPEDQPILPVSSVTGEGCRQLWKIIMEACETGVNEFRSKYFEDDTDNEQDEEYDDGYDEDEYERDDEYELDDENYADKYQELSSFYDDDDKVDGDGQ